MMGDGNVKGFNHLPVFHGSITLPNRDFVNCVKIRQPVED